MTTPIEHQRTPAPVPGRWRALVPHHRGHWMALGALVLASAAVLAWTWQGWVWMIEHWRLSLATLVALGLWLASQHHRHQRARQRLRAALEDAPSALTAQELVSLLTPDYPPELVRTRLHELVDQGQLEVLGLDEPDRNLTYRLRRGRA